MKTIFRILLMILFSISVNDSYGKEISPSHLMFEVHAKNRIKQIDIKPDDILKVGINERIGAEVGIEMTLTTKCHAVIEKITKENIGRRMLLRIDGETIYSGTIMEPIKKGKFVLSYPSIEKAEGIIRKMGRKPDYYLKFTEEEMKASKTYGGPLNSWSEKAMKASESGDNAKAIEFVKKAIESDPNRDFYHLQLGYYYYRVKKYRLALEEALAAERLSKKEDLDRMPGTYFTIAQLYEYLKEYEKSMEYLNKILSINENNLSARLLLADVYERAGKYDLAIKEYSLLSKSDDEQFREKGLEGVRRLKKMPGRK